MQAEVEKYVCGARGVLSRIRIKNNAPAIALAVLAAPNDAILVVTPSTAIFNH